MHYPEKLVNLTISELFYTRDVRKHIIKLFDFIQKPKSQSRRFWLNRNLQRCLVDDGASCHVAAMSADPRFMTEKERKALFERLTAINAALVCNLEEEIVTPYPAARQRLRYAGVKGDWEQ
jgi:hypothetical protein